MFQTSFPKAPWEAEDVLVAGDTVVVRGRVNGTNEGEFMGMPATNTDVSVPFIDILGFGDDGLIHEHWGVFDMMSMMQQLGVAAGAPA